MKPSFKPKISLQIQALAYDRALRNRRPVFAMQQVVNADDKSWHTERVWTAVGSETVALERAQKYAGSVHISTELPTLNEYALADCDDSSYTSGVQVMTRLSSTRKNGEVRTRDLDIAHPLVTLATLPLFVAENWQRLLSGQAIPASYLVLKVQRAATVDLSWVPNHTQWPMSRSRRATGYCGLSLDRPVFTPKATSPFFCGKRACSTPETCGPTDDGRSTSVRWSSKCHGT